MDDGEVIEASYVWTIAEGLEASEANYLDSPRRFLRLGVLPLMAITSAFGASLIRAGEPASRFFGWLFLAFNLPLLYSVTRSRRRRDYRRGFRKRGLVAQMDQKVTFVIDEGKIRMTSAGADSTFLWELVRRVAPTPSGFLIHIGANPSWLPYHAFRDDHDRERFADLASRKTATDR